MEKVLEAVEKARTGLLRPRYIEIPFEVPVATSATASALEPEEESDGVAEVLTDVEPYKCYVPTRVRSSEDFYEVPTQALAELVRKVVAVEGPIHEDELARRMAACYGMSRVGNKIGARVRHAVAYALTHYGIVCRGKFLWLVNMAEPCVRSRSGEGPRDIELISPEEIARAARQLLKVQFGMDRRDLVVQTARVLGFNNTGTSIAAAIEAMIEQEIIGGHIRADGENLIVV
jgi:hypothetical protein